MSVQKRTVRRKGLTINVNLNPEKPAVVAKESVSVDPGAVRALLGRALTSDDVVRVDADAGVCYVNKYAFPLKSVLIGVTKTVDDVPYPREAFLIASSDNVSDWKHLLWESPSAKITRKSIIRVLGGIRGEALSEDVKKSLDAIVRETLSIPPTVLNLPVFGELSIPKNKAVQTNAQPLASCFEDKSDDKGAYSVFRVKQVGESFYKLRNVELFDGVIACVGYENADAPLEIAEIHFTEKGVNDAIAFSVEHGLDAIPNIPVSKMASWWEVHGCDILPVLKNENDDDVWPYNLSAVAKNIPTALAESDLSADELLALGYNVSFELSMGCDSRVEDGCWGFHLKSNPANNDSVYGTLRVGKASKLTRKSVKIRKEDEKEELASKIFPVGSGEYTIVYATPNQIYLVFDGDVSGVYRSSGSANYWSLDKVAPYELPDMEDLASELFSRVAKWALYPKDPRGGGVGHHVIDVDKVAKHKFQYHVIKSNEQRYTLGVAYPANELDAHGEFMTEADLERTAWMYGAYTRNIGLDHAEGTDGAGTVVESYIYRGPDWDTGLQKTDGEQMIIKSGDWLVGTIWDVDSWQSVKTKQRKGYSMQGWARDTKEVII